MTDWYYRLFHVDNGVETVLLGLILLLLWILYPYFDSIISDRTKSVIKNIILISKIGMVVFFSMGMGAHIIITLLYDLPGLFYHSCSLASAIENIFIFIINFMSFGLIGLPYAIC